MTDTDPIIEALTQQVSCYRRLAKLAELQHEHVQHSRTEELLKVLSARQAVVDQTAAFERIIAPAKRQWDQYLQTIPSDAQAHAKALLAETRSLLEQITTADRNDTLVLQQRKLNLGKQITQTATARQVNQRYAASAYGKAPPRMDLQR